MIRVLRSFRGITRLCHVLSAVVCEGKSSLWSFVFYYECYVCNASVERNLNHFIVYLIT